MFTKRLSAIAFAAAFAVSSAFAMLQSPASAAPDSNTRIAQQRHDHDAWNRRHRRHHHVNNGWHNGHHNGSHKRHVDRDHR